jgi:hypothetical protein
MASNVVQLHAEPELTPPNQLSELLSMITDWADLQGVDIRSDKYKYECATVSTLLQLMAQ